MPEENATDGKNGYLTLSRTKLEEIIIHDRTGGILAEIVVESVRDGKVRLAIRSPDWVGIDRAEVYEKKFART